MASSHTEVIVTTAGGGGWSRTLASGVYIIGHDEGAHLRIEDDELVSRKHARLILQPGESFIEDLHTPNGTLVNGSPVSGLTRLWPNQSIRVGGASIELRPSRSAGDSAVSLTPVVAALRRALPPAMLRERKYEIGKLVAQGGMGAILNAREAAIQRSVAMKVMLSADAPEDVLRFIGEAKITGQLEHPSIVPIYELSVNDQDQVFYTMKFVRGITLREVLERRAQGRTEAAEKYTLAQLLTVFQKVCDAVAFAHSKSVIHRDLKPENIMLGDFGEVLVMDWGLAKILDTETRRQGDGESQKPAISASPSFPISASSLTATLAGSIMGTPQYMAPEQANGEIEALDQRTDVYALGAILYQILTLRPPVAGDNIDELLNKVRAGAIVSPAKAYAPKRGAPSHLPGGRVPDSLAAVAMKALSLHPESRYHQVAHLQADVTAYQNGFATQAEHAGFFKQLSLLIKRHKVVAASAALLLLVSAGFMVKVIASERRATTNERRALDTLGSLRGTAPVFYEQAQALIQEQKFEPALEKISYAVDLVPENAEYQATRGNVLQSMRRFGEAAKAYELVLAAQPDFPFAEENQELSAKLAEETRGGKPLPEGSLRELAELIGQQDRPAEAMLLLHHTQRSFKELLEAWRARLSKCGKQGWDRVGTDSFRLRLARSGLFTLDMHATAISDLSPLKGMPLRNLNLIQTNDIHDLAPLVGLPLEELSLGASMALDDISVLKGMHLRKFVMQANSVSDIGVLVGMPIEELQMRSTFGVYDFEPIRDLPLRGLSLQGTHFGDLKLLTKMKLTSLDLTSTKVKDFSLLRGMKLVTLGLGNTPISDLSVLEGMPLKELRLANAPQARDLRPLASLKDLEWLILPDRARDIEFLRQLPKLRRLGMGLKDHQLNQTPTVEKFWRDWDARTGDDSK